MARISLTQEQVQQLPQTHQMTIPASYLDEMGHMNIQWYFAIFDRAAWNYFASLGMSLDYYEQNEAGSFALQQFINYLAEVRVGQTVTIYTRALARSEKRIHFMHFMWNDDRETLSSTLEVVGSHVDMSVRRTSPFPPHIAAQIDAAIEQNAHLGWDAPVCGVMNP